MLDASRGRSALGSRVELKSVRAPATLRQPEESSRTSHQLVLIRTIRARIAAERALALSFP
jgi:hypothetical protein